MAQYIDNTNALDPTDRIAYRRGKVTKADYLGNLLDVVCDGNVYKRLPVFYHCKGNENEDVNGSIVGGSYAFTLEDEILVRFYNGHADRVCGFYGDLWPCIPMPAMAFASDTAIFSKSIFQDTDYIEADPLLFIKRYSKISEKDCDVSFTTYANKPLPEDVEGKFSAVTMSGFNGTYYYRDTTFYYGQAPIYSTYNYETTGGVFNGTRSNIIAAFVHPITKEGILVYQINNFTDWLPQVSGRVDFSFYIYCSSDYQEFIASGYSIVSDETSEAFGTGIPEASGFYTDTAETGYAFCMSASVSNLSSFSAEAGEQTPSYGFKTHKLVLSLFYDGDGGHVKTERVEYDDSERLLMPDGEYRLAEINFYRKK